MMSKTFAAVLLVTSMMALATVAHGMSGGFSGGGGAIGRNQGPGTGRPMLMAGICLCITIILIITAGGATVIDTAGKLRPQASVSSASQPWRKAFD
jgi:hypothetical protein